MGRQSLKVMLVEDHEVVREGLRMVLESTGDITIVAEATTATQAITNAAKTHPDVVVMDVRLLEGNGIEATREIRNQAPRSRILMLTSFQDDEALFASIMAGAVTC
jgi:DNA-binding NarL/FixJ family response regulator